MGREFELKYRATEEQLKNIEAIYGGFREIRMETTYYDAPDGIFSRLHWSLRRRMENGKSVCTLKTPLPDGSRGEWETECDKILNAIEPLCALGAPKQLALLTAGGVEPVCGAKFTRLAGRIDANGCTVELALDRGVLTGGRKILPFAEVEVELKDGAEAAAVAFAEALARELGLRPEPRSKVARARALAQQ